MSYTIGQIAALLGCRFGGDGLRLLERVSKWETADEKSLIFLEQGKPTGRLEISQAGCIIAPEGIAPAGANAIFSEQPKLDFARAAAFLHPRPKSRGTRHCNAIVSP